MAIGEGPEYVPLVRRSHELWRRIEQETGSRLMTRTGGLMLGRADSGFLAQTRDSARQYEIDHEHLSNAEVMRRFPMFKVDERTEGYYEPEAGYVRPELAVHAQLELARRRGARLRLGERVTKWTAAGGHVTVDTDAGTYEAEQLVLCAGPWVRELFPDRADLFAIYRQVMYWFPIERGYRQLREMPIFVLDFGGERDGFIHLDGFYGFPAVDGPDGGVKLATESYQQITSPDDPQPPATRPEIAAMHERCVSPHLPWLGAEPLRTVSCLYTNTRGSRFVIDRHPEHDAVLIVSACSGHGFKHSAAIGESAAQLLSAGSSEIDLTPFALPRAGQLGCTGRVP